MKYNLIILHVSLLFFVCHSFAQIKQIRGKKFSKQQEIRVFDFLNKSYEADCAGTKVNVRKGVYKPDDSSGGYFEFNVSVSYGDITGDNIEEAIVVTRCSGAVQNYDEGKIYTVRNQRLIKLTELEIGTKNDGSIIDAKIKNRRIIIRRGARPNLCKEVANSSQNITTFRLLPNNKLQQVGKTVCKIN